MGKSFRDSVVYHLEPEKDVDRETGLIIEGNMVHGLVHPELGHILLRPEPDDPAPAGN